MATEKDLINAVRDSLKANGELGRIKAEMRAEVVKLLDRSNGESKPQMPLPPHDVIIINELIREYFDWIGYKYTSTVFIAECDLSKQPLDRTLLVQGLGLKETERREALPLLCSLVETFKNLNTT